MLGWVLACATDPAAEGPGAAGPTDAITTATEAPLFEDVRLDFPDPPEGGKQIVMPDTTIPPYTETFICYYGTWTDEDVGVVYVAPLQPKPPGHHNQMKAVPDELAVWPDGTLMECPLDVMNQYTPFFEAVVTSDDADIDPTNMMILPEGVAVKLAKGQHWVLDTHWINTTATPMIVNAAINLGFMDINEVEHWASSFQMDVGELELPPHELTTIPFDCGLPEDTTVLSLLGHMHVYGSSYLVDHRFADGSLERVYQIDEWIPEYRDEGQVVTFAPGELVVNTDETLYTTCSWNNTTDDTLGFPTEMCTTVGVGYPLEHPYACFRE